MADNHVCPPSQRLTDTDARHLLADGLIRACHVSGPAKVALAAGCDEKTIRRSRDEESTLRLDYVLNVLDADPHALDALLAAKGFMLVPMMQVNAADIIPAAGAAIHRIGQNRAEHTPGGFAETDIELIGTEAENDALLAACLERRSQINAAKLRRSGKAA